MAHSMIPMRPHFFLSITAAIALTGCAGQSELYPSLSIRDAERVSGTFEPVEAEPFVPTPTSEAVLGRIGALGADAARANDRFMAAAERTRGTVAAARGASPGSENWSVAQVALAELESSRSDAMIALAELDQLFVQASLDAAELSEIEQARAQVAAIVASQDQTITSLHSELNY